MALGTLTMTWLLLSMGGLPSDVYPMKDRNISIPIKFDQSRRQDIKELDLYVSIDQGHTWNKYASATPDQENFQFIAPKDGLYWFGLMVVDPQGRKDPADETKLIANLKTLVDTEKPLLRITSAERKDDEMVVNWEIQDENPDLATIKLEYRPEDSTEWATWPVSQTAVGQARFKLNRPVRVSVRMQVADLTGNLASAGAEIQAPAPAAAPAVRTVNIPAAPLPAAPLTPPPPSTTGNSGNGGYSMPQPVAPTPVVRTEPSPYREPAYTPVPPTPALPSTFPPAYSTTKVAAVSEPLTGSVAMQPGPLEARQDPIPDPTARLVNSKQVILEYQVDRVGPSGIGRVEVWVTQNESRTWQRLPDECVKVPTLNAEALGDAGYGIRTVSQKSSLKSLTVDLPGEGIYGFRMVLQSKASLESPKGKWGNRPPSMGEAPDIRVEVDMTPPTVELYFPESDLERRDVLNLSWKVTDRNLDSKPITLEWAERPNGTWQKIAANIPNTGQYAWQLPREMPYRVYLRLIATDMAGNVAKAETHEPVLIDLVPPSGRFVDGSPARR